MPETKQAATASAGARARQGHGAWGIRLKNFGNPIYFKSNRAPQQITTRIVQKAAHTVIASRVSGKAIHARCHCDAVRRESDDTIHPFSNARRA
jgi:hypothetical protein